MIISGGNVDNATDNNTPNTGELYILDYKTIYLARNSEEPMATKTSYVATEGYE